MGHSRNIKGKAKKLETFFENHLALPCTGLPALPILEKMI